MRDRLAMCAEVVVWMDWTRWWASEYNMDLWCLLGSVLPARGESVSSPEVGDWVTTVREFLYPTWHLLGWWTAAFLLVWIVGRGG